MAAANLDLVRAILAAWECGDFSSAEWADPEIEYVIPDGPAQGAWTGLAGMAQGVREFLNAWEELSIDVQEYVELDDERVLVLANQFGQGKMSGVELRQMHPAEERLSSTCVRAR
ncbi:MAG TPA: hypothetical protein VIM22_09410 [Solirubrobacteraceae bacterium]|jgi:hypothetical protein